jgi:hypothetical protein
VTGFVNPPIGKALAASLIDIAAMRANRTIGPPEQVHRCKGNVRKHDHELLQWGEPMDIVRYMVLQLAVALKPESPEQAIMYAEEMLEWLQEDNPVVDDERETEDNVVYIVTRDEQGTEH